MNLYIFGRKDHETRDSRHICLDVVGTHNKMEYCKNKLMRITYCHVYKLGIYQLIIFYPVQIKIWNIFFNLIRHPVPERFISIFLIYLYSTLTIILENAIVSVALFVR